MPIYVFRCDDCGEKFERLQKLSDADPDTCPHCGETGNVRRQVTAPAFRLAGSGWYETDFKSAGEHKYNLAGGGADRAPGTASAAAPSQSAGAAKPAAAGGD
ncbi:MAG: zinc ribbon domain-containing protein [Rhodanobacteraceae bacterium]|nr:MAG: zinc ribbon domain-containing protein [Rhodanobacteraceae bacterium]